MPTASALLEIQRSFLAALYDDGEPGPAGTVIGNGLDPAARLRIYRHASAQIHAQALRTSYPAVLALVGEDFFEAARYRRAFPSRCGNLQAYGADFAEFLESLPETAHLPYLGDVARLEWRRQLSVLAADCAALSPAGFDHALDNASGPVRIVLHPSVHLLASRYPVLSLWNYAMDPVPERFELADRGENVVLWRCEGAVSMAPLDAASHACIAALAHGRDLDAAHAAACEQDEAFDLGACVISLLSRGLIVALAPSDP